MATNTADRTPPPTQNQAPANPAETYEHYMGPPLFAPAADLLLRVARPRPGERVLDIGTGTGIVARRAAAHVAPDGTLTGLDPSPGMLEVARTMGEREGVTIDWQDGRAEAMPFPNESFDLALSQYAMMFFADRAAALSEIRRVLVPDGRVAFTVFQGIDRHPFYVALDAALQRALGESAVGAVGAMFVLGDTDALRSEVAQAGFREVTIEPFSITARFPDPEMFLAGEIDVDTAAIPAMQGLDPAARRDLTAAIAREMADPLRAVTEGDHVCLEFHNQIVHARR